jgi:anti-sigma B factor antagonist
MGAGPPPGTLRATTEHPSGLITLVRIAGEVDLATTPAFEAELGTALWPCPPVLLLDVHAVPFMSCGGVSALHSAAGFAQDGGTDLRVVEPARMVRRVLDLFSTPDTVAIYSSHADACADLPVS